MQLLHRPLSLVQQTIYRRSYSQRATNDRTYTDQEAREGLGAYLTVNDLHGRDVLRSHR